jgi:hypothetical protein
VFAGVTSNIQYIEQYMNKIEINNKENKQRSNYIQTVLYIWLYLQKLKACIYCIQIYKIDHIKTNSVRDQYKTEMISHFAVLYWPGYV